ncbi:MAG: hypothetical protein ABEH77_04135, partial [Halobacteriaceae archaeon]
MNVSYEGPTEFAGPDGTAHPVRLTLATSRRLPEGTAVSAVVGRSFRSVRTWALDGVAATAGRVEVTQGVPDSFEAAYRCHIPASYRDPPRQYRLVTATVRDAVPAGADVTFDLSGTLCEHAGVEPTLGVWLRWPGEDEPSPVGDPVSLDSVPGEPAALEVRARPEPEPDGRHRVVVFAADGAMNPVPSFDATVTFDSHGTGTLDGLPDAGTPDDDGRIEMRLGVEGGPVRVAAATEGLHATGPALFGATPGATGHYYGGIHFHSRHSHDGDRTVRGAYRYARDYLNLDAVAVTDHTPGTEAWERTLAVNEAYDDPGAFV